MKNGKAWVGIGIFLLVGIMAGFMGIRDYFGLKNAKDISTVEEKDYKNGLMVRGKTKIVMDYYCYETSDGNETYRWYLVPADNTVTGYDVKYIGVKVNKSMFSSYEAVLQSTGDYWEGKGVLSKELSFQGRMQKVTGDIESNLKQYITELAKQNGHTYSEYEKYFSPYCRELKTTKGAITNIVIAAISFVLAGLILILSIVGDKREKNVKGQLYGNQSAAVMNPWQKGFVIDDRELEQISYTGGVENAPREESPVKQDDGLSAPNWDIAPVGDEAPTSAEEGVSADDDTEGF